MEEISTGKIFVTPDYATAHGISSSGGFNMSEDDYLKSCGDSMTAYPQYKTVTEQDTTKINSFTPIANGSMSANTESWNYSGAVANSTAQGSTPASQTFINTVSPTTVSGTALTAATTTLQSGTTYTISDAAGLNQLASLVNSGISTSGVKIVLANDIDMSSISNFTSIGNTSTDGFKGTFDGNGHVISNLTESTTSNYAGLFGFIDGGTVENVGLKNVSISGGTIGTGALAGIAFTGSTISNCYVDGGTVTGGTRRAGGDTYAGGLIGDTYKGTISNSFSTANVIGNGADYVGGFIGYNSSGTISKSYSTGNVSGSDNDGGSASANVGIGGFVGVNVGSITNAYSTGDVTNSGISNVGEFVGSQGYYTLGSITNAYSTGSVSSSESSNIGGFVGTYSNTNGTITNSVYNSSSYSSAAGSGSSAGITGLTLAQIKDASTMQNDGFTSSGGWSYVSGLTPTFGNITVADCPATPSVSGLESNIYAGMIKSGSINPDTMSTNEINAIKAKITTFINSFADNSTDNAKLYNLNSNLYNALTDSTLTSTDTDFLSKLANDINGGTTTNTASYQSGAVTAADNTVRATADESWTPTESGNKATMSIPSINTIATQLALAFKKAGYTSDDITSNIITYLQNNYSDLTDDTTGTINKAYLAEMNKIACDNATVSSPDSDLQNLYSNYTNNTKSTVPINQDIVNNPGNYDITMSSTDQSSTVTSSIQYGTKDEQVFDHNNYAWDYTDTKIAADVETYNKLKGSQFIVLSDNAAASNNWVTNMINSGIAQFTTFDITTSEKKETSLADETSLQEVSNDTYLKKAEATYEAQMTKINNKETNIDNQLEELDTERTAIKNEEDSLKQVIKDNVNLNFKLFS